jgi:hypothetical protein
MAKKQSRKDPSVVKQEQNHAVHYKTIALISE